MPVDIQEKSKDIKKIRKEVNDMIILSYLNYLLIGVEDAWKLMKISFLFDWKSYDNGKYGFNAEFFRYNQGAYSKKIAILREKLLFNHFLTTSDVYSSLSQDGYKHLESIEDIVKFKNTDEFSILKDIINKYKDWTGRELMGMHYTINVKGKTIENYSQCETILNTEDFADREAFVDKLKDEKLLKVYSMFLFANTHGETLEYPNTYNNIEEFKLAMEA